MSAPNSIVLKVRKPFKNSLLSFATESQIVSAIIDYVQTSIPNYIHLKTSIELLEHIAQIVIDHIPKSNDKSKTPLDVSHIIVQIMTQLFGEIDINSIQNQVKYFQDNKILKKTSFLSRIWQDFLDIVWKRLIG